MNCIEFNKSTEQKDLEMKDYFLLAKALSREELRNWKSHMQWVVVHVKLNMYLCFSVDLN